MSDLLKYYLPHSTKCFVCGEANNVGLKCRFYVDEKGHVHLDPVISPNYAGFMNVVHGGVQSAMLDEAMGWCGFTQTDSESLYFTRELTLKFRRNVVPLEPVHLTARLTDVKRNFVYTEGIIEDGSGNLLTTATGIFIPIPREMMSQANNELYFINDDRLYYEKALRVCNPTPSGV